MIYNLVTSNKWMEEQYKTFIINYILSNKIQLKTQLKEASTFVKKNLGMDFKNADIQKQFEERSGVGMILSNDQVDQQMAKFIQNNKE